MNRGWYIYIHLRGDTNEPFYVGKGKGRRAYVKRSRSFHWNNIVKKYGYVVSIIEENLTEIESNDREIYWISLLGRQDLGMGSLVNFTNGGEGSSGRPMNEKTKQILSLANKNRPPSDIQRRIVGGLFRGKYGVNHNRSQQVKCVETGIVYGSQSEAQRQLKLGNGSVSWSIKFKKPIYGMHFEIAA